MRSSGYVMLAVLAALGVAGCTEMRWAKPGATVEDFNRDSHECGQEAQRGVFVAAPVNTRVYRSCMFARGYRRIEGGSWVGLRD
ncbi:MAG: hypothetical protein DME01_25965 [Candidatus Rokuibacteriota bacterium]|nr:MAG: hypothetical protein DME01_25965 [Candidatus Rokubacteria bacterium]